MLTSLIITTYNRPDALEKVIDSIAYQTVIPTEVIIADDGSSILTRNLIDRKINEYSFPIHHSWQEDKGFRLARSRNLAIKKTTGDYIIFVDGDVILEKNFVSDHLEQAETGCFLSGSRVLLSEHTTKKILSSGTANLNFFSSGIENRKNTLRSKHLRNILSFPSNKIKGIRGCNMSFFKEDCLKINGFNNNFIGWGREDTEFVIRFLNSGAKRKNLRFGGIQYHLWHGLENNTSLEQNEKLLKEAIEEKINFCANGINDV